MNSADVRPGPDNTLVGLRTRWRLLPAGWRVTIVILAAVVIAAGLIKLTSVLTEGNSPEGPDSSSFSTAPNGLAAFGELLKRSGDRVTQLTSPLGQVELPSGSTVFVVGPTSWQSADSASVARVLASGGIVVVAGEPPAGLLPALLGTSQGPEWSANEIPSAAPVGSGSLVFGVTQVESTGPGSWTSTGETRKAGETKALLASGGNYLALSARVGRGTLVLLSSPSPLQNRLIGQADNAAFALDIAGSVGRPVLFDEYDHGYGRAGSGVGGLPGSWKAALLLAFVAVLVWILSASRRFGPPEKPERELAPARVAYVDAIATLLSTAHSESVASAAEPLQARARVDLCRRAGVAAGASDEEIARAAAAMGLSSELVEAVLRSPRTANDLVAVGRVSAELSNERWSSR